MNNEQALNKAKELITGERRKEYGSPVENFNRIAKMWSIMLNTPVTAAQVALCMICVKMTRLVQTEDHKDSWVDLAGYAGCGAEVTSKPELKEVHHYVNFTRGGNE